MGERSGVRGGAPEVLALFIFLDGKIQHLINIPAPNLLKLTTEVESSRTSLASRTSSRTDFEVLGLGLGLEGQVLGLGLGLEASSPRKLACPRLEDSTIFWKVKIL